MVCCRLCCVVRVCVVTSRIIFDVLCVVCVLSVRLLLLCHVFVCLLVLCVMFVSGSYDCVDL